MRFQPRSQVEPIKKLFFFFCIFKPLYNKVGHHFYYLANICFLGEQKGHTKNRSQRLFFRTIAPFNLILIKRNSGENHKKERTQAGNDTHMAAQTFNSFVPYHAFIYVANVFFVNIRVPLFFCSFGPQFSLIPVRIHAFLAPRACVYNTLIW